MTEEAVSLLMDTKTRAELRRQSPWETKGAYEWVRKIRNQSPFENVSEESLMAITPVIAEIRSDSKTSFGVALKAVSEQRVRRLLAAEFGEDLQGQVVKMIRLLRREVSVHDVAATMVFWGNSRKRRIAKDYFQISEDAQGE